MGLHYLTEKPVAPNCFSKAETATLIPQQRGAAVQSTVVPDPRMPLRSLRAVLVTHPFAEHRTYDYNDTLRPSQ